MAEIEAPKVTFGEALEALRKGRKVRRLEWPRHHHLQLDWPHGPGRCS
jgi:hypothetical protein